VKTFIILENCAGIAAVTDPRVVGSPNGIQEFARAGPCSALSI